MYDFCGINLSFHIDYCKSATPSILAIHVGSLRLAPITCNRPQQVFPRGFPKILNTYELFMPSHNTAPLHISQHLDGSFIHTQKGYDCGFGFINFSIMLFHGY